MMNAEQAAAEAEAEFRSLTAHYRIHSGSFGQMVLMCLLACYGTALIAKLRIGFMGDIGNFIWHSLLTAGCAAAIVTLPVWYWHLLGKCCIRPDYSFSTAKMPDGVDADRERLAQFFQSGYRPPAPVWLLGKTLLLIVLFENFIGNIWMQGSGADRYPVWQPGWLLAAADWVRSHTDSQSWLSSLGFKFYLDENSPAARYFVDSTALLHSELGTGALFLQFTRLFTFPVALFAISRLSGLKFSNNFGRRDPANIRNTGSLIVCLLLTAVALPLAFPLPLLPLLVELSFNVVADPEWLPASRIGIPLPVRLPLLWYWMGMFVGLMSAVYLKGWPVYWLRRRQRKRQAAGEEPEA